ncbi:MAG: hypothetical protein Q4A92_12070 [Corynebacterium sp.]|nr:hypothetical protein [Corynebacterium sp.]
MKLRLQRRRGLGEAMVIMFETLVDAVFGPPFEAVNIEFQALSVVMLFRIIGRQ